MTESTFGRSPRHLAQLITRLEKADPDAIRLVLSSRRTSAPARLVGVTGPPGAGKSTLIGALTTELRRRGSTVAVVAVDPSSRVSGGSILGDRLRMLESHDHEGVFIRSLPSRGQFGGLSAAAPLVMILLAEAGFDYVIAETVGVGQSETSVASVVDCTVVVHVPGMGDHIQAMKSGIMDIGDIQLVNKADHPGAGQVVSQLTKSQTMRAADGWVPPILESVAVRGEGVPALVDAIDAHSAYLDADGGPARHLARVEQAIIQLGMNRIHDAMTTLERASDLSRSLATAVESGDLDVFDAVNRLVSETMSNSPPSLSLPC